MKIKIGDQVKIKYVSTWIIGTVIDIVEKDQLPIKIKPIPDGGYRGWIRQRIAKKEKNCLLLWQSTCPYWSNECAKEHQCSCQRSELWNTFKSV